MEAVARRGNGEIVKRDVLPCASPVVPAGPLPRTLPGKSSSPVVGGANVCQMSDREDSARHAATRDGE